MLGLIDLVIVFLFFIAFFYALLHICTNPIFHSHVKHLTIDYHFGWDPVANKQLQFFHVPSIHKCVNLLIKVLLFSRHNFLMDKINVVFVTTILRGMLNYWYDRTINCKLLQFKFIFINKTLILSSVYKKIFE